MTSHPLCLTGRVSDEWIHRYTPDLIKGDLDSLRADVREYYSTKVRFRGSAVGRTALRLLRECPSAKTWTKIPQIS